MGLIARVAKAAGIDVRNLSTLELISATDAAAFLRAAESHKVAILCIDGFRIEGNRPVPDVNSIADSSSVPREERVSITIAESHRFLADVAQPDMYFDFVVEESGGET